MVSAGGTVVLNSTTAAGPVFDTTAAGAAGDIDIDNQFTSVTLHDNIRTAGGTVSVASPLTLAADVVIDTTNVGAAAAGADISLAAVTGTQLVPKT